MSGVVASVNGVASDENIEATNLALTARDRASVPAAVYDKASAKGGTFQLLLHKRDRLAGTMLADLDYPLLETGDEWVVHGFSFANYLAELGDQAQRCQSTNKSELEDLA